MKFFVENELKIDDVEYVSDFIDIGNMNTLMFLYFENTQVSK